MILSMTLLFFCLGLTYLLPETPWAHRAATKSFHLSLSRATIPIVPQEWPNYFNSCSTVLRQVTFGRPLFLFPSGVQCRAVLQMFPSSLLNTWPIHRQRFFIIIVPMSSWLDWDINSSLVILFGQKIFKIFLRFFVWKVESFTRSCCVMRQHSAP